MYEYVNVLMCESINELAYLRINEFKRLKLPQVKNAHLLIPLKLGYDTLGLADSNK